MTAPVDTHPKGRNRLRVRFLGSAVPKAGALIRKFLNLYRERQARKRLAEIVAQTASSYETQRYRERRAAAMKGAALKREKSLG